MLEVERDYICSRCKQTFSMKADFDQFYSIPKPIRYVSTVEPLYRGHIGTLETVLYIEVVLNSEVIVQWNLSIEDTLGPWKLSFI